MASVPLGQVSEDVVSAESAGARSLEDWRAAQRHFYDGCRDDIALLLGEPGWRLSDEEPMIITRFALVK